MVNKERHTNLTKMEGYVKDANAVSVQVTLVTQRDGRESSHLQSQVTKLLSFTDSAMNVAAILISGHKRLRIANL